MDQKQIALAFQAGIMSGKVRETYAAYIHPDFRHHNPYYPGDAASLMVGMEENAARFPDKVFTVERAIEEGDLVVTYSRLCLQASMPEMAVVHIFRFANEKIIELWDIVQAAPEDGVNEQGFF